MLLLYCLGAYLLLFAEIPSDTDHVRNIISCHNDLLKQYKGLTLTLKAKSTNEVHDSLTRHVTMLGDNICYDTLRDIANSKGRYAKLVKRMVHCVGDGQAFILLPSKSNADRMILKTFTKDRESVSSYFGEHLDMSILAPVKIRGRTLDEWTHTSGFAHGAIESINYNGAQCLKMPIRYRHSSTTEDPRFFSYTGFIIMNRESNYRLEHCDVDLEFIDDTSGRRRRYTVDYKYSTFGETPYSVEVAHTFHSSPSMKIPYYETWQISNIATTSVGSEFFTLSNWGLGGGTPDSYNVPWFVWLSACGVACIIFATVLAKMRNKSTLQA